MRRFILGTDWWSDCDDAVALRVMTKYVRDKRAELLGVLINATMEYSAPSLYRFLELDGLTDVPIGIDKEATDFVGIHNAKYQKRLADGNTKNLTNGDFPDAVRLYRKLLSEAVGDVEIIEIGFLQVIRDVLKSAPDDISEKSGLDLFREKVKRVWSMAGRWDKEGECEHNFANNERSRLAGYEFLELCPVPVTFLGFEAGLNVITGGSLEKSDHLYRVLDDYGAKDGRHSWDPMLTLLALIGDPKEAGYSTVTGYATLSPETGANYFKRDENGPHSFVIKDYDNGYYEDMINSIL